MKYKGILWMKNNQYCRWKTNSTGKQRRCIIMSIGLRIINNFYNFRNKIKDAKIVFQSKKMNNCYPIKTKRKRMAVIKLPLLAGDSIPSIANTANKIRRMNFEPTTTNLTFLQHLLPLRWKTGGRRKY